MPEQNARQPLTPIHPEGSDYPHVSFDELLILAERNVLLLESTDEGFWDWDLETGAVWYSSSWQTMLGYAPGEIAPRVESFWELLHPDDQPRIDVAVKRVLARQDRTYAHEVRLRQKDGSYRWVLTRGAIRCGRDGRLLRMAGCHQDISARKEAEAHLMEAQRVGRIGSWSFDLATQRTYSTPECLRLFGQPPSDDPLSFAQCLALLPESKREQMRQQALRTMETGEAYTSEVWVTWPDGTRRCLFFHVQAQRLNTGCVTELFGTIQDVTERREVEERLQQAREAAEAALRSKSQFLANMSHEIRTPMNGILGVLGVLQEAVLTDEQRELLRAALGSGQTLLGLLNDFLDLAKIEAGKMTLEQTPFVLRPLLQEAVMMHDLAARTKGVTLHLEVAPDVPESLLGDPVRLRQIIFNLLSNAVKFTAQGHIRVRARRDPPERPEPARLRFDVSDTGVGIPKERLAAIFDAFTQADGSVARRFGGTGLGLTICRTLVELMGGTLTVESAIGVGTTFSFTARLPTGAPVHDRDRSGPTLAPGRPLRILLAEDNPLNARLMLRLLERLGHEVSYAEDGAVAVSQWQRGSFDLVLMDVQMPEMDGLLATRTIRALERERGLAATPIVALTANALRGDCEECLASGMDDYLTKPIDRRLLGALMARLAAR